MITRIEAYRYRCFKTLDLALDQQHVFAGSNGSGKTTLLDIPALLGDLLSVNDINDAFFKPVNGRTRSRANAANELVHKLEGDYFYLAVEARVPEEQQLQWRVNGTKKVAKTEPDTMRYELAFKIVDNALEVTEEHLLIFKDGTKHRPPHGEGLQGSQGVEDNTFAVIQRSWRQKAVYNYEWQIKKSTTSIEFALQNNKLAFGAMPADEINFPAAFWLLETLKKGSHCYEPQWSAMRMAASPREKNSFKANGASLPWQVFELQQNDPEALADWIEIVQMALPSVVDITAQKRVDDGYCYLEVTYNNNMKVPSSGLSHGTLHILALTIIPFISNPPQVITLEEPENGIHPKAIDAVLEALKLTDQTQLWLSTHSPVVLANTELAQIITMRIDDEGATQVLKGSEHPRLKHYKGEVDLGSLFAAGVLE